MIQDHSFFYRILNHKTTQWFAILLATVCKSILTAEFSSYEGDKSFYLLMANNLGSGDGFTIPVSLLSNPAITEAVYLPSANTPGYSLIAALLLKIFPGNYYFVTWLIESLSWLFLFIVLHRILGKLLRGHFWPNLFVIFSGFFLYNIEITSSSKDILATSFIFLALYHCFKTTCLASRPRYVSIILLSLLFLLPGITKSIYLPLAIAFPFSILFAGFIKNQRWLILSGLLLLFISIVLLASMFIFFNWQQAKAYTEYAAFFSNRWPITKGDEFTTGFYPENLRKLYPFFPASVINLDWVGIQVRAYMPSLYYPYGKFLSIVNITGIAVLAGSFFYFSKKYFRKIVEPRIIFLLLGTITTFTILLVAGTLSLRFKALEYKGSDDLWTYVYENRPFMFSILFIQLLLVVFLFAKKHKNVFLNRIRLFLLLIMGVGLLHGFYFVIKTIIKNKTENPSAGSVNKQVTMKIDSIQSANPGIQVWLATEMQQLDWYAKLQNKKVLNQVNYLNQPAFQLPSKTILVTALAKEDTGFIRNYISRPDVKLLANYDDVWLVYLQENK